jgi:hypothetical protein
MYERVWLAVVTRQETEPLHRIEEFDCARGFLTGQLALRSRRLLLNGNHITDNLKILRGHFAATIDQIEFKLLPLGKTFQPSPLNCADVDKDIFAAGFLLNEAKTLLAVEELHCAFAGPDNLGRHAVETAAAASATAWSTATAATRATPAAAETITAA